MSTDPSLLAHQAVASAMAAGAGQAEATVLVSDTFSAEARDDQITKLEQSVGRSLSLRVFVDGRKATLGTTDLSRDGLKALIERCVGAARSVERDPLGGLPEPQPLVASGDLRIEEHDVRARTEEEKLADVLAMEREMRAYDARIDNSNGSRIADAVTTLALVNSLGFEGSYTASSVSLSSSPVARDGEEMRTAHFGSSGRGYARTEAPSRIARVAAQRAVQMCGARKPQTALLPVIFERDIAAVVLGDLFAACSGANVSIENSFLAGRLGERIGSDLVTIVDDGLLPGGMGTQPFDSEGVPARKLPVFEHGVLRNFLFDTYHARKLGAKSTGNAHGGGVGPNNFYLLPGSETLEELIARTPRGILVLDIIGFATEHVTGTWSRGASGFAIENGKLAYPVDGFTIAGNLCGMLGAIDGVANDLIFESPIVSPSLRVAEMTVSGG
ncbi:MAG: TldD/PmbA family protein [bacterium]|nr:TldD/PmbA family protein [bacterium]